VSDDILDFVRTVATLAAHLPAGTTTSQWPDWNNYEIATFLAERMHEAGYRIVRDPALVQLKRDQQIGDERRQQ
jgi:hypothetical protein